MQRTAAAEAPAADTVLVTTAVEKDCQSAPFHAAHLFADDSAGDHQQAQQVRIFVREKDVLECSSTNWAWIKAVRLAEDCHSYNLELRPHTSQVTFALAVTAKIRPTERPILWFSREILSRLRVPHLSLANIKGEKKYICHRCPFQCEMPNPLKIHLALECGSLTKEDLWRRLWPLHATRTSPPFDYSVAATAANASPQPPSPTTQPARAVVVSTCNLTTTTATTPAVAVAASVARATSVSAFKPYRRPPQPAKIIRQESTKLQLRRIDGLTKLFTIVAAPMPSPIPPPLPTPPPPPPPLPLLPPTAAAAAAAAAPPPLLLSSSSLLLQPLPLLTPAHERISRDAHIDGGGGGGGGGAIDDMDEATAILYKRAVEMETIASNLGKFKRGHLCIYCGKVYSRKYGLKIHIRTHTGFKPLNCKFCLRPFGDPSNLNKHVRLHSHTDAPYKCEQCGKILVRKRDLDRHTKSRH